MTAQQSAKQSLVPFPIGLYRREDAPVTNVRWTTPTPLLDPSALKTAALAYEEALAALRARTKSALRPATCHALANKILAFAVFGERDLRSLKERALAHFP